MKDLIAKLQMDANCALGAIWMHIDAQVARIAELEAENSNLRYELNAALSGGTVSCLAADTDKLREAILVMPFPEPWGVLRHDADTDKWYEPDDPTAADIRVYSQGDLNEIRIAFADLVSSTALQAPVREVPENDWISAITAPNNWRKIAEHGNPPEGFYMAIYKGDGKSMPVTLAGYGEYEFYSEDDDRETTGIGWVEYSEDPGGDCFTIVRDVIAYLPVNVDMASLEAVRASLPAAPVQEPKPTNKEQA